MKETFTVKTKELQDILYQWDDGRDQFEVIDNRYKFHGVDHDDWEFEAIIKRKSDGKYFSVIWFDSYCCTMSERFGNDYEWELTEVIPKQVITTIYE